MFVSLGFVPIPPEFLCPFCVLSAHIPVSTNSLKVTNNEDSLLKKQQTHKQTKKINSKTYIVVMAQHHLLTQWVAHQAEDPAVWLEYIIISQ